MLDLAMSLPRVLSDPPWRKPAHSATTAHEPAHAAGDVPPAKLVWAEGEREHFRGKPGPKMTEAAEEKLFERLLDELDKRAPLRAGEIGRLGDEKLAELAGELDASTTDLATLKLVLGRLGDDFVDEAVGIVRSAPRERGLFEAAMPIESAELAKTAATLSFERAVDTTYTRSPAEAWMLRHPSAVVRGLSGDEHKAARAALAYCAVFGTLEGDDAYVAMRPLADRADLQHAIVLATREDPRAASMLEHEPAAAAYVARARGVQAEKELAAVPEAVAPLPAFFDVGALPKPCLKDGTPLPDEAVRALGEMLRFSPLARPYAGIAQVREACDPASLEAFALALLARWREAGEEPRDVWALETCGKIGGDACAREIATRVRAWAREAEPPRSSWDRGSHEFAYARTGCAILVALGTETSRLLLDDIARGGVQGWLRREATAALGGEETRFDDVEAPVPDVGLDADGSATFDTGKRTYRMAFDEALTPYLVDAQGERVASFPRARKDDDPKKHAAAKEHFTTIVKDAKIVARFQVALLERMMCSQRTFAHAAFRERFIDHPFLRHLGRRVVWLAGAETFRIAEDGTFANAQDERIAIPEARVGVAHPITMTEDLRAAWTARFADYRIMQPFPQLGREVFSRAHDIARAVGSKTTRGRLFQLGRRDWRADFRRGDVTEYTKELPCGAAARFEITPPVVQGGDADQVFTIAVATCTYARERLPPIDYSELMRDLEYARVG